MKIKTLTSMLLTATLLLSVTSANEVTEAPNSATEDMLIADMLLDESQVDPETAPTDSTEPEVTVDEEIEVEVVEEDSFTVTFDVDGGSSVSDQTIDKNETVSLPQTPTRSGYTFMGWYADEDFKVLWDFSGNEITEDTTIFAKWAEVTYTVVFQVNGGSSISSKTVAEGDTVVAPSDPTRSGFTFAGWYADSNFVSPWNFSTDKIEKNTTIYAQWEEIALSTSYGYLVDAYGNYVADGEVYLMQNGSTRYTTTSDATGKFSFINVTPGYYNLTASYDGVVRTEMVQVEFNQMEPLKNIDLPWRESSSVVSISSSTYVTAVDNVSFLADTFAAQEGTASTITTTLRVMNQASTENKEKILEAVGKNQFVAQYFEVNLQKSVQNAWHTPEITQISDIDSPIEIVIDLPTTHRDLEAYMVYRIHDGLVDVLTTTANTDNEYIKLSDDGRYLHIYTKHFSTYALAFADGDFYTTEREYSVDVQMTINGDYTTSKSIGSVVISDTTPKEDDEVVITVDVNDGFAVEEVIVLNSSKDKLDVTLNDDGDFVYTHEVGNAVITIAFVTTIETGTTTTTPSNPSTSTTPSTSEVSYFSDISVTDSFCSAVNEVVNLGLMSGTGSSLFSPYDPVNRGMLVTMLYNLSGAQGSYQNGMFTDVKSSDYYSSAVAWAKQSGVIAGYADGTFRPEQSVTREELATILYSYADKTLGVGSVLWVFPLAYNDTDDISSWAVNAVTWTVNQGLMSQRYNNFFVPWSVATRAEVAVAVVGLVDASEGVTNTITPLQTKTI